MRLLDAIRSWDRADLERLRDEFDPEFQRARYVVGTEFGHWHARYYTQTSAEDRVILAIHIQLNGSTPMYRFFLESLPENFYRAGFRDFVSGIFSEGSRNSG